MIIHASGGGGGLTAGGVRSIEIDPISTLKNFAVGLPPPSGVATKLVYADRGSKRGRVNIVAT